MNKHSIIRLITIFFVMIFILINALFWVAHQHLTKQHDIEQVRRFLLADKLLHNHNEAFTDALKELMIQKSNIDLTELIEEGKTLMELPFGSIIKLDKKTYFINKKPPPRHFEEFDFMPINPPDFREFSHFILEDIKDHSFVMFWLIVVTIDTLIFILFIYIVKKLSPLRQLKDAIIAFKDGDLHLNIQINGKDEISQIADEFNTTLEKLTSIREARSLFLRNILHELKTPIMKGSLTTDCLGDSVEQERLKQIFSRMDFLLSEFAKMEQYNSQEWKLNPQEYRFVDLLDHACDMLICDKDNIEIKGEDSELLIEVDFELFTIALKNLIDNALRYSQEKPHLQINTYSIDILSVGEELPLEKQDFKKSFNRDFENSSVGLGLGLYLSNSILEKHNFKLHYSYQNGLNCFSIIL